MRIECKTIDAFCKNIDLAKRIFQGQIFINDHKVPMDGRPLSTTFKMELYLQASTVLQYPNGEEALLVASECCGIYRLTGDDDGKAQEIFDVLIQRLNKFCEQHGFVQVHGVLAD